MANQKQKVLVGMSGGVDSSVAAALLLKAGYQVEGVTLQFQDDEVSRASNACCSLSAINDARQVANKLGVPFHVFDFTKVFDQEVIQYFISEYQAGRTPNPCVVCNRQVKFAELLNVALDKGFDYIATGHYAKISEKNGRWQLAKASNSSKDQSYALYSLTQEQLSHCLFPLADFTKDQVRALAKELELRIASKPDSQDICFVRHHNYAKYIEEQTGHKMEAGDFVDREGRVLGRHRGLYCYTVGQRKGLGIASTDPYYVLDLNIKKNQVILGREVELYEAELIANNLNWIAFTDLKETISAKAKIRYGSPETAVKIEPIADGKVSVHFEQAVRALTPGQSIVFYQEDQVIGGGVIEKTSAK